MFLYTMTSVVSRDCETQGIMDQNSHSHEWVQTSSTNSVGLVKGKLHIKTMITSTYFRTWGGTHGYFILSIQ